MRAVRALRVALPVSLARQLPTMAKHRRALNATRVNTRRRLDKRCACHVPQVSSPTLLVLLRVNSASHHCSNSAPDKASVASALKAPIRSLLTAQSFPTPHASCALQKPVASLRNSPLLEHSTTTGLDSFLFYLSPLNSRTTACCFFRASIDAGTGRATVFRCLSGRCVDGTCEAGRLLPASSNPLCGKPHIQIFLRAFVCSNFCFFSLFAFWGAFKL
jgi:hypothetical protein